MRLQVAFERAWLEIADLVKSGVISEKDARDHALHKALEDWHRARRRVRRRQRELDDEDEEE